MRVLQARVFVVLCKSPLLCFILCFSFLLFSVFGEIKAFLSSRNLYIEIAGLQNKTPWHSLFYSCCPHKFQLSVNCTAPRGNLVVHRAYTAIFACQDVPGYRFFLHPRNRCRSHMANFYYMATTTARGTGRLSRCAGQCVIARPIGILRTIEKCK